MEDDKAKTRSDTPALDPMTDAERHAEVSVHPWDDSAPEVLRAQMEKLAILKRKLNEGRASDDERYRVSKDETLAALMQSPSMVMDPGLSREERRRRQAELNRPAIELLQWWLEDDEESEEEQQAALEELKRAIDSHRPPGAKLYS